MTEEGFIHFAVELDGEGGCRPLNPAEVIENFAPSTPTWVHLDLNDERTEKWIERNLGFIDPLIRDALMSNDPRPRMEEFDTGLLVLLRAANLNEGSVPHDMISVRLWIDENRIVSLQGRKVRAVWDVRDRLERGLGPKTAGGFLARINLRLIERIEPIITELDEMTDTLESRILEGPDAKLRSDIVSVRQQAIVFRRFIAPQRDVVARLKTLDNALVQRRQKLSLQESHDDLTRFVEELETIRERAQIVQDELTNSLADRLNKRMYVLSVIAAIFLPLGFLTGLLGINVAGIPGASFPFAFWVFAGFLLLIVSVQIAVFRWQRWF